MSYQGAQFYSKPKTFANEQCVNNNPPKININKWKERKAYEKAAS